MLALQQSFPMGSDVAAPTPQKGRSVDPLSDSAELREVNHRASNSLQIAASILRLHARDAYSPDVRRELEAAASRIRSISLVHERLYKSDQTERLDLGVYLRDLVSDIQDSYSDGDRFEFRLASEVPIYLHPNAGMKLGIVITELLTNSVKYAGSRQVCSVTMSAADEVLELIVSDNGPGLPAAIDAATGVGMKLVHHQLTRLNATMMIDRGKSGAHFVITMPIGGAE